MPSYKNCIEHLHECIINVKKYSFLNEYIDEYLKIYPDNINYINAKDQTLLILASLCPTERTIQILLNHGVNIDQRGKYGRTALMCVIMSTRKLNKSLKLLIKRTSNINIQDDAGKTALALAVIYKSSDEIVNYLIKYRSNIDQKDKWGDTPITHAFKFYGTHNLVGVLLPNRKIFIDKFIMNRDKIIENDKNICAFKVWKFTICDFKIICNTINSFREILFLL